MDNVAYDYKEYHFYVKFTLYGKKIYKILEDKCALMDNVLKTRLTLRVVAVRATILFVCFCH